MAPLLSSTTTSLSALSKASVIGAPLPAIERLQTTPFLYRPPHCTTTAPRTVTPTEKSLAPAPWTLHGQGYVFPFHLTPPTCPYVKNAPELPFVGGVGALMFVNYSDSPVGPYKELVFAPGAYEYKDGRGKVKTARSITGIWVDNEASQESARCNWGIPKQLAEFDWTTSPSGATRITVTEPALPEGGRGSPIIDVIIENGLPIAFPFQSHIPLVNLDLLDLFPLVQAPLDEDADKPYLLKTALAAKAWVKPVYLTSAVSNKHILPEIDSLWGVSANSLELIFKEPNKLQRSRI